MSACLCYISLGPREDAEGIARTLVEERLAAAVNLHSGVTSFYRWRGRVEEAAEVTLIAKTRAALIERLTRARGRAAQLRMPRRSRGADRGWASRLPSVDREQNC